MNSAITQARQGRRQPTAGKHNSALRATSCAPNPTRLLSQLRMVGCPALLAQDLLVNLGKEFTDGGAGGDSLELTFFLLAIVTAILVISLVSRHVNQKERGGFSSYRALFRELCRKHELNWKERRLLCQLARRRGEQHPVFLFADPAKWDIDDLGPRFRDRRGRIAELARRLFPKTAPHK
jgi:hypothetical protein